MLSEQDLLPNCMLTNCMTYLMPWDNKVIKKWNSGFMFCNLESTDQREKKFQKVTNFLHALEISWCWRKFVLWNKTQRSNSSLFCWVTWKQWILSMLSFSQTTCICLHQEFILSLLKVALISYSATWARGVPSWGIDWSILALSSVPILMFHSDSSEAVI